MNIERAATKDAAEILALQILAYQSEADIYNDHSIAPLTQSLEDIRANFGKQAFFKVTIDGKIIGSVRAHSTDDTCYIGRLIVHPDFQDRGIGTQLMNEVESHFKNAKRFELFTGSKSGKNLHLYRKLGYKIFRTEAVTAELTFLHLEKTK
ncbi:MAG: GNAT family N-acetyltransferase [Nitrospinae bacterium]|nr:GNAT family N-acetyltransferase [Nitrospinota bacterium]